MAFLGSVGKLFGISTAEAANIAGSFATGGLGQAALTTLQSLGDAPAPAAQRPPARSPPTSGVDSPATVAPVSRTSRTLDVYGNEVPGVLAGPRPVTTAGFGVPGMIAGGARIISQGLRKPGAGSAITGFGAGAVADSVFDMFGNEKKLVITRKLQRDVKKVFMLSGGDISFVSSNSMMLFGKQLSEDQILQVLFKTFKNQGPFITKAAMRKTAQTVRKMERLTELKDRLCPPRRAPARRRMPAKSTTITNVR